MFQHFWYRIAVIQEGKELLPCCDLCVMHMPKGWIIKHLRTEWCDRKPQMRRWRWDVEIAAKCAGDLQSNRGGLSGLFWGSWLFQIFGAGPILVRQILIGGFPDHLESKTSLGTFKDVAEEGGRGPNHLIKFLPRGGPGGATIWVRNLDIGVSYASKTWGGTRAFYTAGDRNEGSNSGGQDLTKGWGTY